MPTEHQGQIFVLSFVAVDLNVYGPVYVCVSGLDVVKSRTDSEFPFMALVSMWTGLTHAD